MYKIGYRRDISDDRIYTRFYIPSYDGMYNAIEVVDFHNIMKKTCDILYISYQNDKYIDLRRLIQHIPYTTATTFYIRISEPFHETPSPVDINDILRELLFFLPKTITSIQINNSSTYYISDSVICKMIHRKFKSLLIIPPPFPSVEICNAIIACKISSMSFHLDHRYDILISDTIDKTPTLSEIALHSPIHSDISASLRSLENSNINTFYLSNLYQFRNFIEKTRKIKTLTIYGERLGETDALDKNQSITTLVIESFLDARSLTRLLLANKNIARLYLPNPYLTCGDMRTFIEDVTRQLMSNTTLLETNQELFQPTASRNMSRQLHIRISQITDYMITLLPITETHQNANAYVFMEIFIYALNIESGTNLIPYVAHIQRMIERYHQTR